MGAVMVGCMIEHLLLDCHPFLEKSVFIAGFPDEAREAAKGQT